MTDLLPVRLLVVDLDDTIWRWFDPWYKSFRVLLDELTELSGCSEDELITAIRPIHQARGTSEYSWLLDELEPLRAAVPSGKTLIDYYDPALHAQNSARREATRLYAGVRATLRHAYARGTTVVAYTESLEFWTRWRIKRPGLDGLIGELYSSPDHDVPNGVDPAERRTLSGDEYELAATVHRHVRRGLVKPSPAVLNQVIADHGLMPDEVVYVGDSLMKDVAMAQAVGARDVWAKYGVSFRDPRYGLLQSVSHWTEQMVKKEQDEHPGVHPTPSFTLHHSLGELLDYFDFHPTMERTP